MSSAVPEAGQPDLKYVPKRSQEMLGYRAAMMYNAQRKQMIEWLATEDAKERPGHLSKQSQKNAASRIDQIHRWAWENLPESSYVLQHDEANAFVDALDGNEFLTRAGKPYSNDSKRKFTDALKKYFKWKASRGGEEWEPSVTFRQSEYNSPDSLTIRERERMRAASLEYQAMPEYNDLTPEERSRKKALLAQRLEKPKSEITTDDWEKQGTTWKFSSLVMVGLDIGARPVEIERARTTWYQPGSGELKIPCEDAAKNDSYWTVALRNQTCEALSCWMREREATPAYDGTDKLWLNREGNPFNSKSLNYHFQKLLDLANIDDTNRRLVWYSIRHSVGNYMTEEGELDETKEQLRHRSLESTLQYTNPSTERRRKTLNKIG